MRCITLADALKNVVEHIRFVSRNLPEQLKKMLEVKGFELTIIKSSVNKMISDELAHAHWLGVCQQIDAQDTIQALSDQTWDWLIVDHYALDIRWESVLRQTIRNIFVIDDIADRQHDCDVLLDQNFYGAMDSRYIGKVPPHCRLLLGPRYALLRDEFRQLRERVSLRTGEIKRVLVFFGGVDAENMTGLAIEALSNIGVEKWVVDVVIGALHPYREQIVSKCEDYKFHCHIQTDRMGDLMAAADLAIGAGGAAMWERCCLGLPTFTICGADNQAVQIVDAASEGLIYAPELRGDDLIPAIKRHLFTLSENNSLRVAISRKSMQVVDGRGIIRVIEDLGCSGDVMIRLACRDDMKKLFDWRNHPLIRRNSNNNQVITWKDHKGWFAEVLSLPNRILLIGSLNNVPIGVVRFDIKDKSAEVSIYIDPEIKEWGLGSRLLRKAEIWLSVNRKEIGEVRAQVLVNNNRSHRLFLRTGYKAQSTYYSKRLQ